MGYDAALAGYEKFAFEDGPWTRPVYRRGSGPAVIIIHEIPGPVAISTTLKTLPDGRVCATRKKDGPCVLTFTKEQGVWKLTSFDGDFSTLRLKL